MDWVDDFTVFDLETTGLSPEKDRVVQFAAARYVSGEEVEAYSTFVNPVGKAFRPGINAVTQEDVDAAPRLRDVVLEILNFLDGRILVAYNAPFDTAFLSNELRREGWAVPRNLQTKWVLDPLLWVREVDRFVRGRGRHKLTVAAERWGVFTEGEAHNALVDVRLTAGLMLKIWKSRSPVPGEVRKALKWQLRVAPAQAAERRRYREKVKNGR